MADGFDVERRGPIFSVTIARPGAGNAITDPMLAVLAGLVREAGADAAVNAVLLRGAGADFCVGRERGGGPAPATAYEAHRLVYSRILDVYAAFRSCPIPVVAVVHGRALGFGCALVGGADVAVASTAATFSLPEMLHGTPPTLAISALVRAAPKTLADLVYSAEEFDARHALSSGIVGRIVPPEALDESVARLEERLAGYDRIDVMTVKRFIATGPGLAPDAMSDLAGYTMATVKSRGG